MIRAIMFDLDGTLVQSEKLRAQSCAIAVQRLRSLSEPDPRAVEAYRETVGAFQDVASCHIIDSLGLESDLQPLIGQYHASETWEVLEAMGKKVYEDMVADPQVIRENQWPHTVGLLRVARETYCQTNLTLLREITHRPKRTRGVEPSPDMLCTPLMTGEPYPEIGLVRGLFVLLNPRLCLKQLKSQLSLIVIEG